MFFSIKDVKSVVKRIINIFLKMFLINIFHFHENVNVKMFYDLPAILNGMTFYHKILFASSF